MTTTFTQPAIPPNLIRKDWDKKKGVFAKAAGRTGIGEQCDALAKAYRGVTWARFDLPERKRVVLKNWSDETFTKANWDKLLNEAKAETLGPLAKVSAEALKLRDLCKTTEAAFRKSKTIPKASADHVKAMAVAAEHFAVATNKNTLGGVLKGMNDDVHTWVDLAVIGDSKKSCVTMVTKYGDLADRWRANPSPKNVSGPVRSDVRRYTQTLGNIAKIGRRGWGPAVPAAQQLFDALTPYADPNDVIPTDASRDESLAELAKFEPIYNRAVALLRSNPLG